MTNITFAYISDIHISTLGNHHDLLSGQAVDILTDIVTDLNGMTDLDFVFIGGDLFDLADQWELDQFQQLIPTLTKPYYIIPGNHDRRSSEATTGLTRQDFARHFNPQLAQRPTATGGQVGYWSQEIQPNIQLIGLDSIRDQDWGGVVDDLQLEWLQGELANHAHKLVIVGIHHPLHALAAIDHNPTWQNFVCDNGPALLTLFDAYPQVKLVLTAHHHLAKVDYFEQRVHIANPSTVIYPCGYRILRLSQQAQGWHLQWHIRPSTDKATQTKARQLLVDTMLELNLASDLIENYVSTAFGTANDRAGETIL